MRIEKLTVIYQGHSAPVYELGVGNVEKITFSASEGGVEFKIDYTDGSYKYIGAREYIAECNNEQNN